MRQAGYRFKQNGAWWFRYRADFLKDGQLVPQQTCVRLCDVSPRYRRPGNLDDLVAEKLTGAADSSKHPQSAGLLRTST